MERLPVPASCCFPLPPMPARLRCSSRLSPRLTAHAIWPPDWPWSAQADVCPFGTRVVCCFRVTAIGRPRNRGVRVYEEQGRQNHRGHRGAQRRGIVFTTLTLYAPSWPRRGPTIIATGDQREPVVTDGNVPVPGGGEYAGTTRTTVVCPRRGQEGNDPSGNWRAQEGRGLVRVYHKGYGAKPRRNFNDRAQYAVVCLSAAKPFA